MLFTARFYVPAADWLGYALLLAYLVAIVIMAMWARAFWLSLAAGQGNNAALMLLFGSWTNLLVALLGNLALALFTSGQYLAMGRVWELISIVIFIGSAWLADQKSNDV